MTRTGLRYAAGALALAVAAIHIYEGFPRLVTQLNTGLIHDPRPLVFVISGAAIVFGIAQILDGRDPEPIYLAGIVLMIAYVGGYVAWHTFGGHGGVVWPWGPDPIVHDEPALAVVVDHLLANPLDLASILLEALLAGTLAVLYIREPQSTDDEIDAVVGSQ